MGGDWFHLADPYLFKIHLGMDPSNSFVQQHIPVTSTNEENIECDCPCSFSLIFNAWFCYISVNKRYICTSNKPVVFPGNHDQGCLRYYNVVRILCKFFQCWCLLVAPIVFLQLQQQFPISLKQIAFFCWQSRVPTAYYHVTMLPKIYAEFRHDNWPRLLWSHLMGAHCTVLNFHQQRLPCCPSVVNIMECEKLYCSSFGSNFVL